MAGVPELEAPAADIQQQQSSPIPTPPQEAFSGAIIGQALHKIASDEYQKSVEAMANQATADFQNFALDKRAEYLNKYGGNAVAAHQETVQALRDKQQEILSGLTSRIAHRLTFDSTERVARLVQESVDSHFVQQNKVVLFGSYQKNMQSAARLAASKAAEGRLDEAFALVDQSRVDGLKQYKALEYDEATAERLAESDHAKVADATVRGMASVAAKNPDKAEDLQTTYDKYADLVTVKTGLAAQAALSSAFTEKSVTASMALLPTMDFSTGTSGKTNPDGPYDADAVRELKKGLNPLVPADVKISKRIDAAVRERQQAVDAQVKQSVKLIDAAQTKGQPFSLSKADPSDVAAVEMNDGAVFRGLAAKADREQRAAEGRELHATRVVQNANFQSELYRIDTMPITEARNLTADDLRTGFLKLAGGVTSRQAEVLVDRWQHNLKSDPDGLQRGHITQLVNGGIAAKLGSGGSVQLRAQAKLEIHQALVDAYTRNPGMTDKDASELVQREMEVVPTGTGLFHGTKMRWQIDAEQRSAGGVGESSVKPHIAAAPPKEQIFTGKSGKKFVLRNGQYEPYVEGR